MKYFVFSDVHGYYSLLMDELKEKGFDENNDEHMLISLGDNFDRGLENYQMYEFLVKMKKLNKIILVKGNHEDLFLQLLYRRKSIYIDILNGTYDTLKEFVSNYFDTNSDDMIENYFSEVYYKLNQEGVIDFVYDMLDYYETNNYIFTHGFIPINMQELRYKKNWRESTPQEFKDSRWLNGMEMSIVYNISGKGKKIVVGHFHSSYGNVRKKYPNLTPRQYEKLEFKDISNFDIYEDKNVIAIDGCTHYTKKINLLVIED